MANLEEVRHRLAALTFDDVSRGLSELEASLQATNDAYDRVLGESAQTREESARVQEEAKESRALSDAEMARHQHIRERMDAFDEMFAVGSFFSVLWRVVSAILSSALQLGVRLALCNWNAQILVSD